MRYKMIEDRAKKYANTAAKGKKIKSLKLWRRGIKAYLAAKVKAGENTRSVAEVIETLSGVWEQNPVWCAGMWWREMAGWSANDEENGDKASAKAWSAAAQTWQEIEMMLAERYPKAAASAAAARATMLAQFEA